MCLKINSGNQCLASSPPPPLSASQVVHHNVKINTVSSMSQHLELVGYKSPAGPLPPNTQELSEGVGGFKVFSELCSLVSEGWLSHPVWQEQPT